MTKMKRANASTKSRGGSRTPLGMNPTLDWMRKNGIPLTAKNYLEQDYGTIPTHLGPEELMEIPEEIREEARDLVTSHSHGAIPAPISRKR